MTGLPGEKAPEQADYNSALHTVGHTRSYRFIFESPAEPVAHRTVTSLFPNAPVPGNWKHPEHPPEPAFENNGKTSRVFPLRHNPEAACRQEAENISRLSSSPASEFSSFSVLLGDKFISFRLYFPPFRNLCLMTHHPGPRYICAWPEMRYRSSSSSGHISSYTPSPVSPVREFHSSSQDCSLKLPITAF